jgi:hypothetical protein
MIKAFLAVVLSMIWPLPFAIAAGCTVPADLRDASKPLIVDGRRSMRRATLSRQVSA